MESTMKPIKRGSNVGEAPAAQEKKPVEEEPGVGGTTVEEQGRAIISAAKRAIEQEKAAGGTKPSPVLRSLKRFLARRRAAASVHAENKGDSTSS